MRSDKDMTPKRTAPITTTLAALAALMLYASPAVANDWIDTRITYTIGDDNFLKDAGEQVPDSPLLSVGDRDGYQLPFDNLDLASTGRENELHLVLYKKVTGILPGLITEAAAALELDLEALAKEESIGRVLKDDSSYIRIAYALDELRKGSEYIDIVLFPLDGDRFRAGYLYDLTWGGSDMFPGKKGPSPAFKIGGNHGFMYWWAGMKMVQGELPTKYDKSVSGTEHSVTEHETLYSGLAGLGFQPIDGLSIDVSGGYVQQAHNQLRDIAATTVDAAGGSARLAYGRGLKVGLSSDLKLLRNDREFLENLSRRPTYKTDDSVNWRVAAEGNVIAQTLADPDKAGSTTVQLASAAALDFRLQRNYLRLNATVVYRSLEFNLMNKPGLPTYVAFSDDQIIQPQIFGAVSLDYHFPKLWLTPGIQAGVEMPPAMKTELYSTDAGSTPSTNLIGTYTVIVGSDGEYRILPEDEDRVPVYSVRLNARWYPSDMLTILAFFLFEYDHNAAVLDFAADQTKTRTFDEPVRIGAGITAQARF